MTDGQRQASMDRQASDRTAGLVWAREWRERTRPQFDAIYGVVRCPVCRQISGA